MTTMAATLGLAILSAVSIWNRAHREIPYPGLSALSAPWSPMPDDEHVDWLVSAEVPPPPADADREALLAWLEKHYPVLSVGLSKRQLESTERHIDLGGWPRHLRLEPGVGLIMRAE